MHLNLPKATFHLQSLARQAKNTERIQSKLETSADRPVFFDFKSATFPCLSCNIIPDPCILTDSI